MNILLSEASHYCCGLVLSNHGHQRRQGSRSVFQAPKVLHQNHNRIHAKLPQVPLPAGQQPQNPSTWAVRHASR